MVNRARSLFRRKGGLLRMSEAIADCFKFRNRIGLDTCVEALRRYRESRGFNPDTLLRYAAICRVKQVMRPYIEAVL
jgi:hypothetical protein